MPLRQEVFANTGDLVGYIFRGSYGFGCLHGYGSRSFFLEGGERGRIDVFQQTTRKEAGRFHATSVAFKQVRVTSYESRSD